MARYTKDVICGVLVLLAIVLIGDKLESICISAVLIVAALIMQGVGDGKKRNHANVTKA